MTQEKPKSDELVVKERRTRKLAYTPEFKGEVALNPNVFRRFLKLKSDLRSEGNKAVEGDLKIELVKLRDSNETAYYKIAVGNRTYFVKELPAGSFRGGGFLEIKSMQKAKEILKGNKINWAEVVDFKLGYEGGGKRYFVSTWNETFRQTLFNYTEGLEEQFDEGIITKPKYYKQLDFIDEKLLELWEILNPFFIDVGATNMTFDPKSKKFYIFDLQLRDLK